MPRLTRCAPHLAAECLIAGKSTVPVGTARRLRNRIRAIAPAGERRDLAWNPEFLREGFAVQDSLVPDRIVAGVTSGRSPRNCSARSTRGSLAAASRLLVMDLETAELVKVAANAFLATKISFINAMAEVCEEAGADVDRRWPRHSAMTPDRPAVPVARPRASAAAACPRTSARSAPPRPPSGVGSVVSLLSEVDAINIGRRDRVAALAREASAAPWPASGSPCWAWRSSPTATTSVIPPAWPCAAA